MCAFSISVIGRIFDSAPEGGLVYIWGTKLNFVALVRKRTILTERPPLIGEVDANFWV
jgi:hypothetical protein